MPNTHTFRVTSRPRTTESARRCPYQAAPVELNLVAHNDGGRYDTGDLAVPDSRGGIRLLGRVADRIGGACMIPVSDVEATPASDPDVDDVGSRRTPAHRRGRDSPPEHHPSRAEVLPALPGNPAGEVRKELLRRWLRGEATLPD
ncbi:hypothetical protein GCM10010464_19760 [Pseudonocardia yunnanensis]|uniref:Uncharacterized protein n=1 Tax=Pseudonocardia yunnanensis TaxID=58107 RepID=A0ABW4ER99_9PSEU